MYQRGPKFFYSTLMDRYTHCKALLFCSSLVFGGALGILSLNVQVSLVNAPRKQNFLDFNIVLMILINLALMFYERECSTFLLYFSSVKYNLRVHYRMW